MKQGVDKTPYPCYNTDTKRKGNDKMIKCPNCGSTAQFKIIYEGETSHQLYRKFKCGCGATAEITYKKTEVVFRSPSGTKL